jgi:hypothetical protein
MMTLVAPLLALLGVLVYAIPGWLTLLPPSLLAHPWHSWALIVPAVALAAWRVVRHRTVWSITAAAWTFLFAGGLLFSMTIYTHRMPKPPSTLTAGLPAPSCTLQDVKIPAAERTLIVFHRGRW